MAAQPTPLSFRDATPADVPALLRLIQSAYRGESSRKGWTTEADLVEGDRIDDKDLLDKIGEPNGAVLVACLVNDNNKNEQKQEQQEGEIVSCCEILHRSASSDAKPTTADATTTATATATDTSSSNGTSSPQVGYFGLFAVDPERQAGGIGRQVLEYAEKEARRRWNVGVMEMTVIAARDDIISWYKRRGYAVTGEKRPFPVEMVMRMPGGKVLRDDLHFDVLVKSLA